MSALRVARRAAEGFYDGLTFHRIAANFVIQGGSPGANEYIGDSRHMRDEVGLWPHVRGAVGISTRGRDTGDAQIFIDLVDNPRFDHEYTVFAQVLNGLDVVDRILEGDTIERIARRFYRSAKRTDLIYRANRNKLTGPASIHPGQALRIPKPPEPTA